jgi:rsbT co-antagonist protein RsbR
MSRSLNVETLTRMLERMPALSFCVRSDLSRDEDRWIYLDTKRAAEVYDVDEAVLEADPRAAMTRLVPEDRAAMDAMIARCRLEAASMVGGSRPPAMAFVGCYQRRDGQVRWLETHAEFERDADSSVICYGQVLDVTERKQLARSLAESEAARTRSEQLYGQVIDALPVGIAVANQAFQFPIMNPFHQRLIGGLVQEGSGNEAIRAHGLFKADGVTPLPVDESGLSRALHGEASDEELVIKNPRLEGPVRTRVVWTPLRSAGGDVFAALGMSLDITIQRALEAELRARNEQLAESEEAKTQLIDRLRRAVDDLSNPILEVWEGVLAMPIIGIVDSRRTAAMVQRLLGEVTRMQASFVIVDLTGVDVLDTKTADHLMRLMRKVEIVGARCVLTGIRAAVAETLVDIGVDFGRVSTLRNLKHGLQEALRLTRYERAWLREEELDLDLLDGAPSRPAP